MANSTNINELSSIYHFKITPLRRLIFNILHLNSSPMGAYEVLNKLKKTYPNSQPPTVYRVLEFFINKGIVHKISLNNKYILCKNKDIKHSSHFVIILCDLCNKYTEFACKDNFIESLSTQLDEHGFKILNNDIQLVGRCSQCYN